MAKPIFKKFTKKSSQKLSSASKSKSGRGSSPAAGSCDLIFTHADAGKKATLPASLAQGPYAALIEKIRKDGVFTSSPGTHHFIRYGGHGGAEHVLFVGVEASAETEIHSFDKARNAGGIAWAKIQAEKLASVQIQAEGISHEHLSAFLEGMVLSTYGFHAHKSRPAPEETLVELSVVSQDSSLQEELEHEYETLAAIGDSVSLTRDWSNQPSNFGTPTFYATEAQKIAKKLGLKCKVLSEAEARREKMGLFLAVGQGSEREGKIVVLEYNPPRAGRVKPKTIALVGKGVTFDSGGISIKPALRMEEMKHDMTGAATVMGAMNLLARTGCPNRVIAVMAFTENMPAGNAVQPGNVITSRSGKTVEIFNTDAEGRLILADALDYAQDYKPDAIIDVATLTGAVLVALGKIRCGLLGNNDELIKTVLRVGETCGERLWQLPMDDEYFDDLKSETADMKNSANDGNGGTIRGAIFLKQFIKNNTPWAHLDIAGTTYNTSHLPYLPKRGANGQFVRTLALLAQEF